MTTQSKVVVPMNSLQAIGILCELESRLSVEFARIAAMLRVSPRVRSLLFAESEATRNTMRRLWECSARTVARFRFERHDTDWVFENFWGNPHEPKHSKLLAYLLDPREAHECWRFLLPKFLSVLEGAAKESKDLNLKSEARFLADGCTVAAESGGHIDLRIERECDDARFAIIIENKVNGAPDQYRFRKSLDREASQLEKYVEGMLDREFQYHEIYVFYLPLDGDRDAKREDVNAITKGGSGATYTRITFKDHIGPWLKTALEDWPEGLNSNIRDHLGYYARLITHLVNKNKQIEMDSEILKSIQQEEQNGILSLSAIDTAIESAQSLRRVFTRVLRGRLLRRIHAELCKRNLHPNYYVFDWPRIIKSQPESDYADEFEKQIVVGVQVNNASAVGFGWDKEGEFFFAYLRLQDEQGQHDETVQREARSFLGEIATMKTNEPYYAYKYEGVTPEQCEEQKTATNFAATVCEMRKRLQQALG